MQTSIETAIIAGSNEPATVLLRNYFTAQFPEAKIKVKRHYRNYQVRLRQGCRSLYSNVSCHNIAPAVEYFATQLALYL